MIGNIFDIQRFSVNDGPGIRTTVFFKGCPLRCLWCDNPESQSESMQVMYLAYVCTHCGKCIAACQNGANVMGSDNLIKFNRSLCKQSGRCVDICPSKARVFSGKMMTIEQVMDIILKDELFYRNSGGGVTASGGEPTAQPEFLKQLFTDCRNHGINTTLDTSGYVDETVLSDILSYVDLVYYDLKHMNPKKHREITGVDNELILSNAVMISEKNIPMVVRLPMIPGKNDSTENIREISSFVKNLKIQRVDILLFHTLGRKKYDCLDMTYRLTNLQPHTEEEVAEIVKTFNRFGLDVNIA